MEVLDWIQVTVTDSEDVTEYQHLDESDNLRRNFCHSSFPIFPSRLLFLGPVATSAKVPFCSAYQQIRRWSLPIGWSERHEESSKLATSSWNINTAALLTALPIRTDDNVQRRVVYTKECLVSSLVILFPTLSCSALCSSNKLINIVINSK